MTDYSSLTYWDTRYTTEHMEVFEWYQTYDSLKEKIGDYFRPEDKILNVGCGTSKLAEDLFLEDIKEVTNIDFCENAITIMEDRYKEQKVDMKYLKMDVMDMKDFEDKSFTIVFDKALLDSILCAENAYPLIEKMMKEVYRVMADDGVYIIISNGDEENRKMLFDQELWEYTVMEIEKPSKVVLDEKEQKDPKNFHYIYILKKKVKPEEENKEEEKKEEEPPKEEVKKTKKK